MYTCAMLFRHFTQPAEPPCSSAPPADLPPVEGEERISCRGVAYLVWAFGQCGYRNRAFLTTAVEAYFEDFKRLTPFESSRLLQVSRGTCLSVHGLLLRQDR